MRGTSPAPPDVSVRNHHPARNHREHPIPRHGRTPRAPCLVIDDPDVITGITGITPGADNPQFNEGLLEFRPELDVLQFARQIFHFGDDGYDIREYVDYSYDE